MSNFQPQMPMPYDLKEFQAKILENRGLHYNFPYGYKPSIQKHGRFIVDLEKKLFFKGLTFRGFFYAPGPDNVEFEVRYSGGGGYDYFMMTKIDQTDVKFKWRSPGTRNSGEGGTQHRINAPGYYSIAVQVYDKKLTKLAAFFKDSYISDAYVYDLTYYKFELRIIGNSHYLISLHASDELEANQDFPNKYFGQSYWFDYPVLGIGSYWIMDCIVTNPDKPLTVCLVLYYISKDKPAYGKAEFPLKNVKRGEEVTVYIRSVRGGWQVTTSFEDKSVHIANESGLKQNYIYPSVSGNCNILTQHAEQGIQRYE